MARWCPVTSESVRQLRDQRMQKIADSKVKKSVDEVRASWRERLNPTPDPSTPAQPAQEEESQEEEWCTQPKWSSRWSQAGFVAS